LFLEATPKLLPSTVQRTLEGANKPFFHHWLNDWKLRNQGVRP
jgi:hypothetical protein